MSWRARAYATVLPALMIFAALCWAATIYVLYGMEAGAAASVGALTVACYTSLAALWVPMTGAMLLPTVAPTVAGFIAFTGKADNPRPVVLPAVLFVTGYLLVWAGFAVLAAGVQMVLEWRLPGAAQAGGPLMDPSISAPLLLGAGLYQFTGLKHGCLARCRSPITFFMKAWRDYTLGALVMGLRHGVTCLGACAGVVLVLFVAGGIQVAWIAMIAILLLAEKTFYKGHFVARAAGVLMVAAGAGLALGAIA